MVTLDRVNRFSFPQPTFTVCVRDQINFNLPNSMKLTMRNIGNCYTPKRLLGKKKQIDLEATWSAASLLGNTQTKTQQLTETPPIPSKML